MLWCRLIDDGVESEFVALLAANCMWCFAKCCATKTPFF